MLSYNRKKGFTLMELLIVVAIIAILVAVAVPVFSSSVEKAEEAVCLANRRSLKGLIVTAYLSGENMGVTFNDNKAAFKCPTGGVLSYTFNEAAGQVEVGCSVHSGTVVVFSSLYQAYKDTTSVQTINSYALGKDGSWAKKVYDKLDSEQQSILDNYAWTITKTHSTSDGDPNGMRVFFADKDKVENGEPTYVYKLNPITGKYQVSKIPDDSSNFGKNTEYNVGYITGYGNQGWGSYVNGTFVKDEWMDALPADLDNPKAS